MWVTSWEKTHVNEYANRHEKNNWNGCWFDDAWFKKKYPDIELRIRVYAHIVWQVRNIIRGLDDPLHATLPDVMRYINIDDFKMMLSNAGLDDEQMPADMWIQMFIETAIPAFLCRKKDYVRDMDSEESLPARFYETDGKRYAILKGEACAFSREYKGWDLYKAIYPSISYFYRNWVDQHGNMRECEPNWKNAYRATRDDLLHPEVILKGDNLVDIKEKVNEYIMGQIV